MKRLVVTSLIVLSLSLGVFSISNTTAYADGNGSPVACNSNPNANPSAANVLGSKSGSDDLVVVDAGAGNVVTGVCIKSGSGTFGGDTHSGVLSNGVHDNGCYQVSGVGTQVVRVTRLTDSNVCKGISHIDVLFAPTQRTVVQPLNPGGSGGGDVLGTTSTNTPAQVVVPGQGVNAGSGPASITAPVVALFSSIGTLGYGILRLRKFNA